MGARLLDEVASAQKIKETHKTVWTLFMDLKVFGFPLLFQFFWFARSDEGTDKSSINGVLFFGRKGRHRGTRPARSNVIEGIAPCDLQRQSL
jgi:hypothetical protein